MPDITLDKLVKVLNIYAGRDKALRFYFTKLLKQIFRTFYFSLVLYSTKLSPERAKIIMALAKQMSQSRLVLRQFNHPSMVSFFVAKTYFKKYQILASRELCKDAKNCSDPIDYSLNGIVTVAYTIYGVCELIGNFSYIARRRIYSAVGWSQKFAQNLKKFTKKQEKQPKKSCPFLSHRIFGPERGGVSKIFVKNSPPLAMCM